MANYGWLMSGGGECKLAREVGEVGCETEDERRIMRNQKANTR